MIFAVPFPNKLKPSANGFSTSVGYFRQYPTFLEHVYGVHYDCDTGTFVHPVFHAQMKPLLDFESDIKKHFSNETRNICDKVQPILRNVRLPSAEMDIFSVFAQITADHLIYNNSEQDVIDKFKKLLDECGFFFGVAKNLDRFNQHSPEMRYRSLSWFK